MSWYMKSLEAGDEGAHVAAVLYGVLATELIDNGDYREGRAMKALGEVLQYAEGLKKDTDKQAVRDVCYARFPGLMELMDVHRETEEGLFRKVGQGDVEIQ